MESTNQDADPTTDAAGDPDPAASGTDGESASDFYDADRPPFGELPEKPAKAPSGGAAGAVPADIVGEAVSRRLHVRVGAAVVAALVALVLLRRRARRY